MKLLRDLSLNLDWTTEVTDVGLREISHSIAKLQKLLKITLYLGWLEKNY